ncbi:MAG: ABC transporter ATP-binding protein [Methylobacteriaceae bacterium]|nr:ABC transporter ATP-binding protein [Methylobacteriaceae bacterium]
MLEAQAVSKHFGGVTAVDDVSFKVAGREIAGLIGPNGAGKTTMFNLLAGSLRPTSGRIRLKSRYVETSPPYARMSCGLGRTFQIPRPFAEMTVMENVLVAARDQVGERMLPNWIVPGRVGRLERANVEKARSLIDFVKLGRLAGEPARTLSGGQRKLLEFARVLMADPEIVLLDEPAAGVNPGLLETILTRIAEINARGVTFLIVEHNMEVIARLCARVLVMVSGRILCEGKPREIAADPRVIEAYLGGAPR